ncbi:hypothetical protein LINGRAHAP2_LOCUS8915 [Linum grandiflorum]
MAPFDFKLENHFVGSSDGTSLQVYELTKSPSHFSSIQKADWKKVATIGPNNQDDDDDGGLLFFDGHGRIEEPEALAMLAGHLNQFRLLASPEGYCFQQASDFGMINYVRLNDLFSWSSYGVELVTMHKWNRLELKLKGGSPPKMKKDNIGEETGREQMIEELEKLKAELQQLATKLKIVVKKKDGELLMLKKKKAAEDEAKEQRIEELEKMNEELEEANKTMDEELRKLAKSKNIIELQRKLKKKDDELQMLKKKKDEEEDAIAEKIVELEKKNEELEEANKAKDEELRKVAKSKKNDDEAAKTEKEFEECRRNSWAILPSTKFIDAKEKHLAIRQRVPPTTFGCVSQMSFPYVNNSPRFVDKMRVDADYAVNVVDEETSPGEWPPPPAIMVHIGRGTDADFDKNNWWCLKTTHRDGGLTMLVYYEGNRSQISIFPYPDYDNIIRLPFSKDIPEVYTFYNHFDLFRLPFGVRFGFAYRPK